MIEFAQPLALWTGLTVGLPVLAHLAYRNIVEKTPFPSLRFLHASTIPRTGRKKPSDWLLLLLRVLLFILITLLLAQPYWREPEYKLPQSGSSECIFILDCSPSMAGWGAWNEAKEEIISRINRLPDFHFGFLAPQDGTLIEIPLGTPVNELLSSLEMLSVQDAPWGIQSMVDRVQELFSSSSPFKKLVVVSDFQKSSWQEVEGSIAQLGVELELVPVGHGNNLWKHRLGNRAILDARVAPAGEGKLRVWTALRNWDSKRSDLNVSIQTGGEIRGTVPISLPPLGTEQAQFVLPADHFSKAMVYLDQKDAFDADNNQSLWILPPLPRTFGFWSKPGDDPQDLLEKQFLRAAMESAGENNWIRWMENEERANEQRMMIPGVPLDLLMVVGISGWFDDEGLPEATLRYLQKGGTIIITPPEDSYVRMNQALKESELLPFTFRRKNRTAFRMEPYRIEVLPENSPLSRVFSGDSVRDLYLTQIRQFISVEEGKDLDVPLRDRSGQPLVLVHNFPNGGRLVFFAFRMIPEWTDLPMRNSFLPLLLELCDLGSQSREKNGETLRIEAGEIMQGAYSHINTQTTGLFRVGDQRVEVVHPLAESMPEVMGKNQLIDALNGVYFNGNKKSELETEFEKRSTHSLWPWFALGAAILLIVEMILSVSLHPTATLKSGSL